MESSAHDRSSSTSCNSKESNEKNVVSSNSSKYRDGALASSSFRRAAFRRDRVVPGASRRDQFALDVDRCALLVIDIQRYLCPPAPAVRRTGPSSPERDGKDGASPSHAPGQQEEGGPCTSSPTTYYSAYYQETFPGVLSNIVALIEAFRSIRDDDDDGDAGGDRPVDPAPSTSRNDRGTTPGALRGPRQPRPARCEVIFTYLQSCTNDGRDISLDYKLSGPLLANIPRPSNAGPGDGDDGRRLFLPQCRPSSAGRGDIRLPKTSCNVFASTNLDYLLRQLGVSQLVLVGQMTEQCVESAVRHAADLGYFCVVASDACVTGSGKEAHESSLRRMGGFARVVGTSELLDELRERAESASG